MGNIQVSVPFIFFLHFIAFFRLFSFCFFQRLLQKSQTCDMRTHTTDELFTNRFSVSQMTAMHREKNTARIMKIARIQKQMLQSTPNVIHSIDRVRWNFSMKIINCSIICFPLSFHLIFVSLIFILIHRYVGAEMPFYIIATLIPNGRAKVFTCWHAYIFLCFFSSVSREVTTWKEIFMTENKFEWHKKWFAQWKENSLLYSFVL